MTNPGSESYAAFGGPAGTSRIARFLEWLAARRGLAAPIRLLDVGCGPGRMFPAFRALGWEVASMEPDADFREAAIVAATAAGYEPPRAGGFLEIDAVERFDLVTAINDPFSHMLTGRDRADALRRVFRALRPDGVLLLDVPNFLWILKHYRAPEPMRTAVPGGEVHLRREHLLDFHAAVFTTVEHYDLIRDGEHHPSSKSHAYAMTTLPELAHHLESAGFAGLETYGSWDARDVERIEGSRLIVSAVRPPSPQLER
jgi:SAM-dependent methyltransferase